jgi:hypothetical protein
LKFFFIKIDNKTDILALSAFLISLVTIVTNIYLMIKGPDISIMKPDQVIFLSYTSKANRKNYLKIYSDIYLFNKSKPGFDDVISKEYANIKIGGKRINLQWQYFATTEFNENNGFIEINRRPVKPIFAKTRQATGGETHFHPFAEQNETNFDNFVLWDTFTELLEKQKGKFITISFKYETFSGKSGRVDCKIKVSERFIYSIKNNNRAIMPCL